MAMDLSNGDTLRPRPHRLPSLQALGALALLLARVEPSRAADPYATALDRRFVGEANATDSSGSGTAALEDGLRAQVREMSQPHQPAAANNDTGVQPTLLWEMVTVFGVGIIALVALRSWHYSLFRPPTKWQPDNPATEDPAMAEFLRAMQESAKIDPLGSPDGKTGLGANVPMAGAEGQVDPIKALVPQAVPPVNENVAGLKATFQKLTKTPDEAQRLPIVRDLLKYTELVKEGSGLTQLRSVWLLATALHGLLKQFSIKTGNMTPSALRTAATAIDLLELLSTRTVRADLATAPPVRLLAVDDDAISRRAVALALKKIFNEPDIAPEGASALGLASQHTYDVIFLDIEMPGMDGFELCSRIHETERNRTTPIVFVTSHHDFDSRAKSALVGAHDLMGKPFLAFEIAVKALSLVLKTRQARESQSVLSEPEPPKPQRLENRVDACPAMA